MIKKKRTERQKGMDVFKIRAAIAAKEAGSLKKAAENLDYTPSAFSHIITGLEEELGVKIFDKSFKGVTLTPAGEKLFPYFTALYDSYENLTEKAKVLSKSGDYIKIGAISSVAKSVLPDLIKSFNEKKPDVKIKLVVGDDHRESLLKGSADLFFTDENDDNFEFAPLFTEKFLAAGSKELLRSKKNVTREELLSFPLILSKERKIVEYFGKLPDSATTVNSADYSAAISMAERGLGVTLVPEIAARGAYKLKTAKTVPELKRTVGATYKKNKKKNRTFGEFLAFLKEYFSEKK